MERTFGLREQNGGSKISTGVVWKPQEKQIAFMRRTEDEVCYGGAAGGGKSEALVIEALRQVGIPHYRALIVRKSYPELSALIDKSFTYYPSAFPGARYNAQEHVWRFPSGAKISFGSMYNKRDKNKYQGRNFDFIGIDELTHFTYDEFEALRSRNRPQGPGTRVYMRMTCNPGGVGHGWVKERYIAGKEPLKRYVREVAIEGKRYAVSSCFVPATVFDNPSLLDNDPDYVARLGTLPEALKKALLYGDWDSFSGQVFTEFRDDAAHYIDRRFTHVIAPFEIPNTWRRYRSFDFGFSRPFSVGWWAADPDGRLYRYRELYGCTGEPNCGVQWSPDVIAAKIKEIEDKYESGRTIFGVADPAIWDDSHGSAGSIVSQMERFGVVWEKGKHDRMAGKMQLHRRFRFGEDGRPYLYVFNTCKAFIRTVPALCYDELDVEDVDTKAEDHVYDETRYMCMVNPISAPVAQEQKEYVYNPLGD